MIVHSRDYILSLRYDNDPRDIPNEIKNFRLYVTKCNYIIEQFNIIVNENDIWRISDKQIDEEKMILKNFISILNRITESNYDSLFNELCKLEKINSKNIIDKSIQSLINNIKTNQVFSKTYARLCFDIYSKNLWEYTDNDKVFKFQDILIENIENEFHKTQSIEKRKEIKDTMESIDDEDELYEYISKEKKKFNGILLLIAHLYLVNMITFPIIEYVLRKLIHPFYENNVIPDEMNLEFLYNIYPIVNTKFTINNWRKIKDIKYAINYIPNDTRIPNRLRLKFMNLSDNNVK